MEEERFVSQNFDKSSLLCQGFQADKFVEKRFLNILDTISEQSDDESLKINAPTVLTGSFSSNNKKNIASNKSLKSDDSTVCATMSVNHSNLMKCEKTLLESSNDEENSLKLEKMSGDSGQLLQFSKKLKFLNDTISTPPSALREQISILRREMNEAYEFHDLEIQILNEERKDDPESYAELIEKYSTLLELYLGLKDEYEEYRRGQEKMRDELQSKTVDCLESLCSQIETSDNSLSNACFFSFNTDFKSSTMIGNFTEKETILLHDVTMQTKDPLSDTDIFKSTKFTPSESAKKITPQKRDNYDSECNIKLFELETALSDKVKDVEKLEQRLFRIEDLSGLLQNEFQRITSTFLKENETLKENLVKKSGELDTLTQKLFTEIISLNPGLDSLVDAPGTKLLPVFIETIMESCKNIQDELKIKFSIEKCEWETRMKNLEEKNKNLNKQISQVFALQELNKSYERQLLETKETILTRDEEIRILKIHDSSMRQMREDLAQAKEEVTRVEIQLSLAENSKKDMEDRCRILEQTSDGLMLDLEKIKKSFEIVQSENDKLKERLLEITTENRNLQDLCERLNLQLSENKVVISSRDEEILNLKNREMKQMKADLAQADETVLKLKAELLATEGEKLNFEKRCLELENANSTLQTLLLTKDAILKDLERFKTSFENEWENRGQEIKEKEVTISDLRMELDAAKQKNSAEVKKTKSLSEEINCQKFAFSELEKSYKDIERKLLDAESKVQMQDESIRILQSQITDVTQTQDDLASAKEIIERLEAKLVSADSVKKEMEDRCRALEEKNNSLCLDLERIKSAGTNNEVENENLKNLIHQNNMEFKFESLFEILKEGKKTLISLVATNLQTENLAFKLIAEQISNLPDVVKLIEIIVEYFNIEWEAKQNVLIKNLQNEIKITSERLCEITSENHNLQEICEQLKTHLTETEGVISLRDQELLNLKGQLLVLEQIKAEFAVANENIARMEYENIQLNDEMFTVKSEKLSFEKRCQELVDINSALQATISAKDTIVKELEGFKYSYESECEKLKHQIIKHEEIVTNLKVELNTAREEIKNIELDNVLTGLQVSCEKIRGILGSGKCSELQYDDLLKLTAEFKSPDTETENRILTQFVSAVFDVRNAILQEWEVQKKNDFLSVKELENKVLNVQEREAELHKRCLELENDKEKLEITITRKDSILKNLEDFKSFHDNECMKIKQQLDEKQDIISDLKFEISALKENYNEEIKKMKIEQSNSEKRYLEVEGAVSDLRAMISAKDANLKELEHSNMLLENNSTDMKQQMQEGEVIIINLKTELETLKEQFSEDKKRLNHEKIDLEKRCLELEDANTNLQTTIISKDIILKDLECLKSFHQKECELALRQIEERSEVISSLQTEILSIRNKWNEEIRKLEGEKLDIEERCVELEDKNTNLLSLIATKDTLLKDLEVLKSSHEKECENIKNQMNEREEFLSNLRGELDTVREKCKEEVKTEIDNVLIALQISCEKLRGIFGSKKCSDMQKEDFLKLMADLKSPETETESKVLSQFISAVFDMRSAILQEWEMQKKNNARLIKELQSKISSLQRLEVDFDNSKEGSDNLQKETSEEEILIDELAGLEKLKLSSVRDFPKIMKKVTVHVKRLQSRVAELKEENEKLDEECDSYAKVIKDLKKEAAVEWKKNNEKAQGLEREILRLTEMMNNLKDEKEELLGKISKLEQECQRLKANIKTEGTGRNCGCGVDFKKVNELKRTILVKEQKLLEFQDLEAQNNLYKSQIEYLKNALDKERKKINEEKEKSKKLQTDLDEAIRNQKIDDRKSEENQILEELRMRGSISGGVVQEIVDKEKMRKLSKDVGVLKEICRARYAEIKRLEAENAALKSVITPKNSNQMDSPIRSRVYNTRSKNAIVEKWRTAELAGKENKAT